MELPGGFLQKDKKLRPIDALWKESHPVDAEAKPYTIHELFKVRQFLGWRPHLVRRLSEFEVAESGSIPSLVFPWRKLVIARLDTGLVAFIPVQSCTWGAIHDVFEGKSPRNYRFRIVQSSPDILAKLTKVTMDRTATLHYQDSGLSAVDYLTAGAIGGFSNERVRMPLEEVFGGDPSR